MTKAISPTLPADLATRIMADPTNPIYLLLQYITEYALPVKVLAGFLGIHPQTIYFWMDLSNDIRPELTTTARMEDLLARLSKAEEAGTLVLSGTTSERYQQLTDTLGTPDAVEPETT